jgi:hypothetical protein
MVRAGVGIRLAGLFLTLCVLSRVSFGQVTVNAGSGAGSFQCTEGAAPTFTASTDILWCDTSHWFMMNNNNGVSTAIQGVVDSDMDNTIVSSAVDGSNNPSFLTVAAMGKPVLHGEVTPFVGYVAGKRVVVNTMVTGASSMTNSTANFVYVKQDGSISATILPPVYSKGQPNCSGTTAPQFWFDTSVRLMKSCASNNPPYTANPVLFLGVIGIDGSGGSLGIAHEPWHLSPYTRLREFGDGSNGLQVVTGAAIQDGWRQYSALEVITGGILQHTAIAAPDDPGLFAYSQNPVLVVGNGKIDLKGLGRLGGAGGTGGGLVGNGCGWGGAGGGGAGSAGNAGGTGGQRTVFFAAFSTGGGAGGNSGGSGNNGSAGAAPSNIPPLTGQMLLISGCGGGSGGGNGTNNAGGGGGAGGGGLYLRAPSVIIGASAVVDADGNSGNTGTGTGAGGGGGGGVIVLDTWFTEAGVTVTAASGAGGAGPTGKTGGAGGAGIVQVIQRQ